MARIKLDSIAPRKRYSVGATPQSTFTVPFPFFALTDIKVIVGGATLPANGYAVTGTAREGGYQSGTVTLTTPVSNTTITVLRDIPLARTTDFPSAGGLKVPALNGEFDRVVAMQQQIADRTIQVPPDDTDGALMLPGRTDRANKLLAFDGEGQPTQTDVTVERLAATVTAAFTAGKVLVEVPTITADGVTTAFPTGYDLISAAQVMLTIGGIFQPPATYAISGQNVVVSEPPPAGADVQIRILGAAVDV